MPRPQPGDDRSTQWFTVAEHIHDRDLAARVCQSVLELVKSSAARGVVDAYTDHRKAMPPDARAAEEALTARGKQQHKRDPGMNVELDLSSADGWDLLARYAPWSINVDVYDAADDLVANFHDSGHDVTARLSADQAAQLSDDLREVLHIEKFEPFQIRERDR
jgi:hypothetical protein